MKVEYRITEDEHVNSAQFEAWRMLRPWAIFTAIGLILVILGAWCQLPPPDAAGMTLFVVALAVLVAALCAFRVYVLEPDRARQRYRQLKADQETQTVELSDEGLRFGSAPGEETFSLPWPMISQWRQNDQFVFIYMMPIYNMPKLHYQLPKSVAEQGFDIPLLVQHLAERVGPERW